MSKKDVFFEYQFTDSILDKIAYTTVKVYDNFEIKIDFFWKSTTFTFYIESWMTSGMQKSLLLFHKHYHQHDYFDKVVRYLMKVLS
jgi:hypothetical protein